MLDGTVLIASLFLWLCKGIYWLAEKAYELLMDIANVQIFDSGTLQGFGQRIYVFLGIIMLFKVAFSLINYIINPDAFTDKGKGVGKLIIDIAVVLLLIVTVPFIFEYAMKFQRAVLNQNVIPKLVLGMSNDAAGEFDYGDQGEKMSFTVFSSFFRVNPAVFDDGSTCLNGLFESGEVDTESENSYGGALVMKDECAKVLDDSKGSSFDGSVSSVVSLAYETNNMNMFTDSDIIKAKSTVENEKVSTFDFMGLIATASGIFLAWIFVMFCFDVAVRAVKLVFLQLIAPVPIVSYIDPKGQKGMFKKWVNACVKTYLDLFIRLIAVFFAIFIVSQIPNAEIMIPGGEGEKVSVFVYVFLIFGVLLFAKQLPKLLEDITGVKFDGGFTLNPMKKLAESPYSAALAGGVLGAAGGLAMNTMALGKNIKKDGWKKTFYGKDADGNINKGFKAFRHGAGTAFSGTGGMFSAGARGLYGGLSGKGKDGLNKLARQAVTNSSKARNLRSQGFNSRDKFENYLTDIGQMDYKTGTTNKYEDQIKQIGYDISNAKEEEQAAINAAQLFRSNSRIGFELGSMFRRSSSLNDAGLPEYTYEAQMRDANGNLTTVTGLSIDDIIDKARNDGYYNPMELRDIETYAHHLSERDYQNYREAELSKKQSKLQKGLDSSKGKK